MSPAVRSDCGAFVSTRHLGTFLSYRYLGTVLFDSTSGRPQRLSPTTTHLSLSPMTAQWLGRRIPHRRIAFGPSLRAPYKFSWTPRNLFRVGGTSATWSVILYRVRLDAGKGGGHGCSRQAACKYDRGRSACRCRGACQASRGKRARREKLYPSRKRQACGGLHASLAAKGNIVSMLHMQMSLLAC